ncbi:MAG: nitroreductase family protein, partial [Chloroflexi bacterium]|nr:nitroreductase family protein [Chloroflexota bacterium]
MRSKALSVWKAIASRRSSRRFGPQPVSSDLLREMVTLACAAPAPHHSRPWRFVHVASAPARERLVEAMAAAWRADLQRDARPPEAIERLLARSHRQLAGAPALLLACLTLEDAHSWADERRRSAERDMFVQSLGAALQNLLLAAHSRGLAGYLKGAPLFCPEA